MFLTPYFLQLFFRLIEELAWVDVDNAFDFYMEWVQQRPSLRTSSHVRTCRHQGFSSGFPALFSNVLLGSFEMFLGRFCGA